MIATAALALLVAVGPESERPFLEPGGIHLVASQATHGVLVGLGVYASAANNNRNFETPALLLGVGLPVVQLGLALMAGHFLRPPPSVANESAALGWAGFFAGVAVADFYMGGDRTISEAAWAWTTRLIAGAIGQLFCSLIPLLPIQSESRPSHTILVAGATFFGAVVMGIALAFPTGSGARGGVFGDPARSEWLVLPLVAGGATSVALHLFDVDATVAPTALITREGPAPAVALMGNW
jgi:hypothetical protein